MFSDAHCHLYMAEDIEKVLKNSQDCNVGLFLNTAINYDSSFKSAKLKLESKGVHNILGIAPDFSIVDIEKIHALEKLATNAAVGIGEIGLDNKIIDSVPLEKQAKVFEEQLEIADRLNVPVVIHSRGMLNEIEKSLNEKNIKKAMFHFFEGNEIDAKRIEKKGYLISIPPLDSSRFKRVISAVDIESLVCETDFPAVGKTPCDVNRVIEKIAKIKSKEITFIGDKITETIKDYFGV